MGKSIKKSLLGAAKEIKAMRCGAVKKQKWKLFETRMERLIAKSKKEM